MARLAPMPPIVISQPELALFGQTWIDNGQRLSRTSPRSSGELGKLFDRAVGSALATMLGGIPIREPNASALTPPHPDCVEVGPVRIIGGVRPQNFDCANAIGAAIAQVSGEVDRIWHLEGRSRDSILAEAREMACEKACRAGADPNTLELIEREEIPLAYLPGNAVRLRVKAAGWLRLAGRERSEG